MVDNDHSPDIEIPVAISAETKHRTLKTMHTNNISNILTSWEVKNQMKRVSCFQKDILAFTKSYLVSVKSPVRFVPWKFCMHFVDIFFFYRCCRLPKRHCHVAIFLNNFVLHEFDDIIYKVFVRCKIERYRVMDSKVEEKYTFLCLHLWRFKNLIHVLEYSGLVEVVWLKFCLCFFFACQL